jgi:hypothetical protein
VVAAGDARSPGQKEEEVSNVALEITLSAMTCGHKDCGIVFAVPNGWLDQKQRDHSTFYCPNGHARCFSRESEFESALRLAREAQDSLARERSRHDQTKAALEHEERSKLAVRGHLTRTKKRVAAGVCPCCNRTFQDLGRHMSGQHPKYAEQP